MASGIITAQRFDNLLLYTVWLCCERHHDLFREGWPAQPDPDELKKARNWVKLKFKALKNAFIAERDRRNTGRGIATYPYFERQTDAWFTETWGLLDSIELYLETCQSGAFKSKLGVLARAMDFRNQINSYPWSTNEEVELFAFLSLHDWRSTLTFLASLKFNEKATRNVLLQEENPYVIDSFNTHITRGRRRNLAHTMLCHLSGRLRMRIILTTNFDTLIEDAFAEGGEPLRVLRVSTKGRLPDPATVHSFNCCVKLHGELHETRADYTLDDHPHPKDLDIFSNYACGRHLSDEKSHFISAHFILLGYSGSDHRCMRLLERALGDSPQIKLFWVFHTREAMQECRERSRIAREFPEQVILTWTERTDLLLYELYQRIALSLPGGGFNYQFNHNYPPQRWRKSRCDEDEWTGGVEGAGNPEVISGAEVGLHQMELFFRQGVREGKECIWLELEDYADVFGLAQELFQIISLRCGNYEIEQTSFIPSGGFDLHLPQAQEPSLKAPAKKKGNMEATSEERASQVKENWKTRVRHVMESWRLKPSDHCCFLYGRNGPGGCKGWVDDWDGSSHFWNSERYEELKIFINALVECGFHITYAPYDEARKQTQADAFQRLPRKPAYRNRKAKIMPNIPTDHCWVGMTRPPLNPSDVPAKEDWAKNIETVRVHLEGLNDEGSLLTELQRFLYCCSLFRQSRHPAALISEAVVSCKHRFNGRFIDNDVHRQRMAEAWLDSKWLKHVMYEKRGGYLWMYRDTRLALRAMTHDDMGGQLVESQYGIAKWYESAFCATGHAEPLLESLYHYWQAALNVREIKGVDLKTKWRLWRGAVLALIKLMRLGRSAISFWTNEKEAKSIFDFLQPGVADVLENFIKRAPHEEVSRLDRSEKEVIIEMLHAECRRHVVPFSALNNEALDDSEWIRSEAVGKHAEKVGTSEPMARAAAGANLLQEFKKSWSEDADEFRLSLDRWRASDHAWKKCYASDRHFEKIVSVKKPAIHLGTHIATLLDMQVSEGDTSRLDDVKSNMSACIQDFLGKSNDPLKLPNCIEALFELTYACLLRAELLERLEIGQEDFGERVGLNRFAKAWRESRNKSRATWIKICVLCRLMLETCESVHPNLWVEDFGLRAKILSIYGLALGRLGRFFEAHRRLNESHAICTRLGGRGMFMQLGIIALRRAEVQILEAGFVRDCWIRHSDPSRKTLRDDFNGKYGELMKESWQHVKSRYGLDELDVDGARRMHISALDAAWMSLERAEGRLRGNTHSAHWWGRMVTLRSRVFAELGSKATRDLMGDSNEQIKCLAFREPRDFATVLLDCLRKADNCLEGNEYEMLRIWHYLAIGEKAVDPTQLQKDVQANKAYQELKSDIWKWLEKKYNDVPTIDQEYFDRVKNAFFPA